MKKIILVLILLILSLSALLILEFNRKTNLYISLQNIDGYNFQLSDSVTQNIDHIILNQEGKLSYQRYEFDIDTAKIKKVNIGDMSSHVTCSTYFITNNFGWNRELIPDLSRFKLFFFKSENQEAYILPIEEVHFIIE